MQIKEKLTQVNFMKVSGNPRKIKYIVIHYTANKGDTAKNNADYFYDVNRNSSAHYFVDEKEIYQVVDDNDVSWHCGVDYSKGTAPFWNKCTNNNSIGIELCSDFDTDYYISKDTQQNAIELVKMLMQKYNVPLQNVIRHYDVCGKVCPAPFVKDEKKWSDFKAQLDNGELKEAVDKLTEKGVIANPDYWKENYNNADCLKYVKDLIIKFANAI